MTRGLGTRAPKTPAFSAENRWGANGTTRHHYWWQLSGPTESSERAVEREPAITIINAVSRLETSWPEGEVSHRQRHGVRGKEREREHGERMSNCSNWWRLHVDSDKTGWWGLNRSWPAAIGPFLFSFSQPRPRDAPLRGRDVIKTSLRPPNRSRAVAQKKVREKMRERGHRENPPQNPSTSHFRCWCLCCTLCRVSRVAAARFCRRVFNRLAKEPQNVLISWKRFGVILQRCRNVHPAQPIQRSRWDRPVHRRWRPSIWSVWGCWGAPIPSRIAGKSHRLYVLKASP